MANTVPESGRNRVTTGNTFLGVRPGTITKGSARAKAKKDKNAALKRAGIVNAAVNSQLNRLNYSAQRAQRAYNQKALATDPSIVNTILSQPIKAVSSTLTGQAGANQFIYKGGQYSGAGQQAKSALDSVLPQPGDVAGMARFSAKRDTATDAISRDFYARHSLDQYSHDVIIERGNQFMTDSEAVNEWLLSGIDFDKGFLTEEEFNLLESRQNDYQHYIDTYVKPVNTYNPETGEVEKANQFVENAPLPPWIAPSSDNRIMWTYYTTYAHDTVQSTVDAYTDMQNEAKVQAKTPYKSAFSTNRNESDIDSFLDIAISSRSFNDFASNTWDYFSNYIVNPIRAGHFATAAGNALWNLFDTSDYLLRGVRAFAAGDTVLGGMYLDESGYESKLIRPGEYELSYKDSKRNNISFTGQQEYWVQMPGFNEEGSKLIQEQFMQNGGRELIMLDHPGLYDIKGVSSNREVLFEKLDKAFGSREAWQKVYDAISNSDYFTDRSIKDLKQGLQNIKDAYSDPASAFTADTGSLASDVILETVLDPTIVVGGLVKGFAKGSIETAAKTAVRDGLTTVLESADDAAELMTDKRVIAAVSSFINSNESKNIIFKSTKNFGEDVGVLIRTLEHDIPHLFADSKTKKAFGDIISAHLVSKNRNINSKIISSTGWARKALDSKTFKAAYYMDKAFDTIDSAIIKSSFAAPWALVKGVKRGKKFIMNTKTVREYYHAKKLMEADVARTVRDEVTNAVDVTSFPKLLGKLEAGQITEDGFRVGLQDIVKEYDNVSKDIPSLIKAISEGKVSSEEALELIGNRISLMTGGKYKNIDELIAQVDSYDVRYAGDLQAAYDRLSRSFDQLKTVIYRKSDAAVADFLTEVGHAENLESLRMLFRNNMDNPKIMSLRTQVTDKALFDVSVDDIEKIVSDLQSGMFSDVPVSEENLKTAVRRVSRASDNTIERVVNVRDIQKLIKHDYSYLLNSNDSYVNKLKPLFELKPGASKEISLNYALECIESAKRSLLTSEYLKSETITKTTPGVIHKDPRMADLRKLKDTIRGLDIISLKDTDIVTTMHVDRMAMMQKFINDPAISKAYSQDYDTILAPAINVLTSKNLDNVDLASDTFVKDLLRLEELKYGRDRTDNLIAELKTINTLSDYKLHALLNGLGNNFGRAHGTLADTLATPGLLRRNLETTANVQSGRSKIGIEGLTDILKSVDTGRPSEYIEPYMKEFEDPIKGHKLKAKYDRIVNSTALDPTGYVKKQMLASLLMEPELVAKYNALAKKGNTPIFFHINTTGLSTEINEITSISCIKWTFIDISDESPLTLEKILNAIPDEPILFKRGMTDTQLEGVSENVLRRMDMKGLSSSQLRSALGDIYRVADMQTSKSEGDVIEEFCSFIQDEVVVKKASKGIKRGELGVPTLVVHDLDGFNLSYFNKRAIESYKTAPNDSKTRSYIENLSLRMNSASDNTYSTLASKVGDNSFTVEELNQIETMLRRYIEDINLHAGDNFDPFDFEEYGKTLERVLYESTSPVDDELSVVRQAIVNASSGAAVDIEGYKQAMRNITDFSRYPKRFAFTSSGRAENEVATALRAVGKDSVNIESRIYVRDVLSFFDIADSSTGQLQSNINSLQKMHNLSQYIIRNRDHTIASTANDFLAEYKDDFDKVIDAVRQIGLRYSSGSDYSFLGHIKTPDTPVESYLMCQKLYDDYIRYWCFSDLPDSFSEQTDVLDSLKRRLNEIYAMTQDEASDLYNTAKDINAEVWSDFHKFNDLHKKNYRAEIKKQSDAIWNNYRKAKSEHTKVYLKCKEEVDGYKDQYRKLINLINDYRNTLPGRKLSKEMELRIEDAKVLLQSQIEEAWYPYDISKEELAKLLDDTRAKSDELWLNSFPNGRKKFVDDNFLRSKDASDLLWQMYQTDKAALWELYNNNPERLDLLEKFFDELMSYFNSYRARIFDEFTNSGRKLGFDIFSSGEYDDIFSILNGEKHPEIFQTAAKSDYSKTVYSYKDGVLRSGIDMASKLSEANANIAANIRQLDWLDRHFINSGIESKTDRYTGMLYMKAKGLYDMLDSTGISKRKSFHDFIRAFSDAKRVKLQQYALDSLRVNGKFDRNKLLSNLVYNNFNHIVFNSHAYSVAEMRELTEFVRELQSKGDDFISLYEDRSTGNIFIYLNYNTEILSDGNTRILSGVGNIEQPVRDVVDHVDFDDIKFVLDIDDIEDYRIIYDQLNECWDDIRVLSRGAVNGTSGRVVTRKQAEEYLSTLPAALGDMLSPKGMLVSDSARGIVYDPGFVINEDTDVLLDFLETLNHNANVAKEDAVIINEVFSSQSSLKFNELSKHFSDDELIQYFGSNPDYVVVTLTKNINTRTQLQINRLRVDNKASLQAAKDLPNTTILPYDMYYELADTMNRTVDDGFYRKLLGKYLLVYKAFALLKPGTWMRNYIDATTKASLDDGNGPSNILSMLQYQAKAARDINTYSQILKVDPVMLNKSNWDIIQKTFKTDMTFEDFSLLRGVMDADRYTSANKRLLEQTRLKRGGFETISGNNTGIRNLDEDGISKAFDKYLADEVDIPFSKNEFLDIYFNRVSVTDDIMEQYEDVMRKLNINLRNADASSMFDKTISNMFKPFGTVENLVRYAQTMYLMDQGLSQNQIIKRIHATQFYTAPAWGAFNKLETIMPFITFRYNNFMYWIKMMDENPRLFRYFEDMYGTIADDSIEDMMEDGEEMDYETDMMFQSGALPLGDDGVYLKVGNSFLSALNDFYGGPEFFLGKYGAVNPLLREVLRFSAYALGFNSKEFFSSVDLDVSKDITPESILSLVPGGNIASQAYKLVTKTIPGTFENGIPTMDTLFQTLSFLGVVGIQNDYSSGQKASYAEWLEELESQGKWFDANQGKIVPLSEKNINGLNDPNISFEDRQAYMLQLFGKVWDANQGKFVFPEEVIDGNFNLDFDFQNDPNAWERLKAWMKFRYGKFYDYNQKKFVYPKDYISGGLNDENITWDQKKQLMYDTFGLLWDANQNKFVTPDRFINGGLNASFDFDNDPSAWNRLQSLRLALYGETYDREAHKFKQTAEPSIVLWANPEDEEKYDNYFSRLGIPRLTVFTADVYLNKDGLLVTGDGKYVLTDNQEYNFKIFNHINSLVSSNGRQYNGFKNYSYNKTTKKQKVYRGRTLPSHYYTGYGWNDKEQYYRFQYNFNYQYHNPQPGRMARRLMSMRLNYPYGGGYNKFSFYTR